MIEALDIRVRGIVQGVGFRPFVYRLARRHVVSGWVLNDLDGVFIHAEGETALLDEFVTELHTNPPSAAVVREVELREVPLQDCTRFEIRESRTEEADEGTLVSADLATCDDCLRELFDPADRRYRYPFINCTNCGPRFTIIDKLPYDRPATSMAGFVMCDDCAREYADPADRRFHAQPDACWECGPQLAFWRLSGSGVDAGCRDAREDASSASIPAVPLGSETSGHASDAGSVQSATSGEAEARTASDACLAAAVSMLAQGKILAVKGLGGFHLACDAANERAIAELRRRKHRDGKPFAVMVPDAKAARAVCAVSPAEEALMASPARPIVLLRKLPDAPIARGLADALPELGVMLPSTPVQHLLLHDFRQATGRDMLVMTSGNLHDEPIVTDDDRALSTFAGIADAVLGNNRPILSRYDDSVVRVVALPGVDEHGNPNDALQFIRRARGYAPVPLALPNATGADNPPAAGATAEAAAPTVFAAGSEQKNTLAFARDGQAFVSQHVGDMEDADVFEAWMEARTRLQRLFALAPRVVACDLHPEYVASKYARDWAARDGLSLVQVQHHHAHIASVLGEHGLFGPAIGIAFDGTGYGPDGAIWGGEVLLANQADYERFANFTYVPMPGGAAAIRNPLRMAYGVLWAYDLLDHPGARAAIDALGGEADICGQMIESGLNTPYTSSVGRLFDAVSAILGVCTAPTYEGEPAVLLDAARESAPAPAADDVAGGSADRSAVVIAKNSATEASTAHDTSVVLLDAEQTMRAVLDDLAAGVPVGRIAHRFHDALVGAIVQVCELARAMYGIRLVTLSGGCFMNRYLVERATAQLGAAGFTVALNAALPPNDGCLSYGQSVVACQAARTLGPAAKSNPAAERR